MTDDRHLHLADELDEPAGGDGPEPEITLLGFLSLTLVVFVGLGVLSTIGGLELAPGGVIGRLVDWVFAHPWISAAGLALLVWLESQFASDRPN